MSKPRGSRSGKPEIVLSDKTAQFAAALDICRLTRCGSGY
jgi:hypothetical protein